MKVVVRVCACISQWLDCLLLLTALSKRHTLKLLPSMSLASQWTAQERHRCTQPRCDALARMARPPQWQTVFADPNLDSFTSFIAHYATEEEVAELVLLPVGYHQSAFDGIVTRIPVGVRVGEQWVFLPEAECTTEDCPRCRRNVGGYSFHWLDPRWTPEAAIDLTQSVEEMRYEAVMPWPRGILREPNPRW